MMGPLFVIGFYVLLGLHVYSYFTVILTVLKKRVGVVFGMVWIAIGLVIVYNIAYNHFFASMIKPGGPSDLKVRNLNLNYNQKIEGIRKELKQREARKDI
jgi:apolipoprotein N-acyltransferase